MLLLGWKFVSHTYVNRLQTKHTRERNSQKEKKGRVGRHSEKNVEDRYIRITVEYNLGGIMTHLTKEQREGCCGLLIENSNNSAYFWWQGTDRGWCHGHGWMVFTTAFSCIVWHPRY